MTFDWASCGWLVLAAALGASIGVSELLSRYRDAPFDVLRSPPGLSYLAVNALASVIALLLAWSFNWRFGVDASAAAWEVSLVQLLATGLGAMAVFRSSLFNIQAGDTQVAVGPNSVLQVILSVLDREVDRVRARPRAPAVADIMKDVDFNKAKKALPTFCFELMQNVTAEEVAAMRTNIDALDAEQQMPLPTKSLILGLNLMNLVGEDVLKAAVDTLDGQIK